MNDGGFVPYGQCNPPFITEDMNVTISMLKHHIMPDGADIDALADALAKALKAQEPVSPTIKQEMDDICSCIDDVAYCGRCGARIGRLKQNYCSECGQAVKWK